MYRTIKFVMHSFRLEYILLTEGSTLRDLGIASLIIIYYWGRGASERFGNSFTNNHWEEGM
jgi:hypothetical protein